MRYFKYIFLFLILTASIAGMAQPVIKFDKPTQHLGFVYQGDTLSFEYPFTNTGNQPLVISDTKVQCGCTIVTPPTQPTLPGKQDVIKVKFVTNTAIDRQDRTIEVISNSTNSQVELRFKCVVLKAKDKS